VVLLEEVEEPPPPAEPDDPNATSSPLASSPAFAANIQPEARPSRSAMAPVAIAVVILVLGLSGILIWAFGRTKRVATVASVAEPAPSAAPTAASAVAHNADTPGQAEAVADAGSTLEPTQPATTPETSESRRSARPDKQEGRPIEGAPVPTRSQKGFRPSGI
jgi:hypothetical protein